MEVRIFPPIPCSRVSSPSSLSFLLHLSAFIYITDSLLACVPVCVCVRFGVCVFHTDACLCVCVVWRMCISYIGYVEYKNQFRVCGDYTHIDTHVSTHTVSLKVRSEGEVILMVSCMFCKASKDEGMKVRISPLPSTSLSLPDPRPSPSLSPPYLPFSPPCLSVLFLSKFCYL